MGSPPQAPDRYDPNVISGSQQKYNVDDYQKFLSGVTQTGQDTNVGTSRYVQTGTDQYGNPTYSNQTRYTAPEQALFNTQQGTKGVAGTQAQSLLAGANYGQQPDFMSMSSGLTADMLNKEVGLLNPYFKQQTESLRDRLLNQGIGPNKSGSPSPAYDFAMKQNQDNQNNAVTNYLLQAEPQAFQQAMASWKAPGDEAAMLAGMGSPDNLNASFNPLTNAPTLQPPNVVGAYGTAATNNQNVFQDQALPYTSMMTGLFGLGGTLGGAGIRGYMGGQTAGQAAAGAGTGASASAGSWIPSVMAFA